MDGPTSRLPSSSVASIVTANLAVRRSMKESCNSAPVSPNNHSYMDPPRPAKEGHEWVWFPAGYWAERQVVESPGKSLKHFKWRKRSGKSSSGNDAEHYWDQTPRTPGPLPYPSPFLTEEAHVQSLQKPPIHRHGPSSESGGSTFPLNRKSQAELPSPYLTEEAHVQSLQRSPLGYHADSSDSGTSLSRLVRPIPSSPLTISQGDSDSATPVPIPMDLPMSRPGNFVFSPTPVNTKPKKSFMARLLPDHKPVSYTIHTELLSG